MSLLYFLLLIVPIIVVHELGHLWVGRRAGIPAEVYSIGFGPEIWSKRDQKGTLWRIAMIPLGGYVRFAPDANGTSFPSIDQAKPPYLAPFWGKIATIFAGPFANFMMSMVIFFVFALFVGGAGQSPILGQSLVETSIEPGDRIIRVNGESVEDMQGVYLAAREAGSTVNFVVEREGRAMELTAPNPNLAFVAGVIPGGAAEAAGIEAGDILRTYHDTPIENLSLLVPAIQAAGGQSVDVKVRRQDQELTFRISAQEKSDGQYKIDAQFTGIYSAPKETYGVGASLGYAASQTFWVVRMSWNGLVDLLRGDVSLKAMSGPADIAMAANDMAVSGFWNFFWFMGMISSAIGFMNLLPLPILDGGHIVLLTYERIFGKLPPQPVINTLFALGIFLLLGVLVLTTINAILR